MQARLPVRLRSELLRLLLSRATLSREAGLRSVARRRVSWPLVVSRSASSVRVERRLVARRWSIVGRSASSVGHSPSPVGGSPSPVGRSPWRNKRAVRDPNRASTVRSAHQRRAHRRVFRRRDRGATLGRSESSRCATTWKSAGTSMGPMTAGLFSCRERRPSASQGGGEAGPTGWGAARLGQPGRRRGSAVGQPGGRRGSAVGQPGGRRGWADGLGGGEAGPTGWGAARLGQPGRRRGWADGLGGDEAGPG